MELLRELVRNIVVILIIGALFDLMMPKGDMNRYLKLAVGLFIMAAMLNPILEIAHQPDLGNVIGPANEGNPEEGIQTILNNGRKISEQNSELGLREYRKRIEQQICALIQMDPGVKVLQASVFIYEDMNSQNYGKIREVNLLCAKGESSRENDNDSIVAPVDINIGGNKKGEAKKYQPLAEEAKARVVETITSFYGLEPEQVHIQNP